MVEKKEAKDPKDTKDVNKSEEIRKAAKSMKDRGEKPRPVAIIATLKKNGVEVSSPQVSMVLKRMGFRPRKRRKKAGGPAAAVARPGKAAGKPKGRVSVEDLVAAKKVVSQFGGPERALAAIQALMQFEN